MDTECCLIFPTSRGETSWCLESPRSSCLSPASGRGRHQGLPYKLLHGDNLGGRRSRLTSSHALSRIIHVPFSAAHRPFLFPFQFFGRSAIMCWRPYTGVHLHGRRGLGQRSPAFLPYCSVLQQRVCAFSFKGMPLKSL